MTTPLNKAKYEYYCYLVTVTDVTCDPGWKRLQITPNGVHFSSEVKMLVEKAKQSESCIESIIWIRSMDQLVKEYPEILERLETTFKPIYEAAKAFDTWA